MKRQLVLAGLAVAAPASAQIEFGPFERYPLSGWGEGYGVALADLDRDGDVDMAGAGTFNPIDGRITVWVNDGRGAFRNAGEYPAGGSTPTGVVAADLDRDGWPDLVYTLFSPGSSVSVLRNDRAGRFAASQAVRSGNATGLAAGDLNGDAWPDIVVSNSQVGSPNAKVFLNNGAGRLLDGVEYAVAGGPRSVTIADLDGDRDADLAVPSLFADAVSVLRNRGDGTFDPAVHYPVGIEGWFAAARDFDGDGDTDLAVSSAGARFTSDLSLLFNLGNGAFSGPVNHAVGYNARGLVAEDFDNDRDFDLAVVVMPQARVFVLANTGRGAFAGPVAFGTGLPGDETYHLAAADLNHDGRIDLAASNLGINHGLVVLLNRTSVACYPDCDASTGAGVLDIFDFLCFQNRFDAGAPYACDCDTSTGGGVCDVFDFLCFQNAFTAGCP